MWSQMGLRKHHYEQSLWRWWNSSWDISNPKRWCCESAALNMSANLEISAVATGLEKVSFHSNSKEGQCQRMFKLPHNCLISHVSKVMLKIPQARLQQYVNWTSRCSSWLWKRQRNEINLTTSSGSSKKQENTRKTSTSDLLTTPKPLTVWITTNCGKFLRWEYQTTWSAYWEICMQVRKQQLELDTEQQTGSKLGKEYIKAVYIVILLI